MYVTKVASQWGMKPPPLVQEFTVCPNLDDNDGFWCCWHRFRQYVEQQCFCIRSVYLTVTTWSCLTARLQFELPYLPIRLCIITLTHLIWCKNHTGSTFFLIYDICYLFKTLQKVIWQQFYTIKGAGGPRPEEGVNRVWCCYW